MWSDIDVLPFVDGPFESIPKASPSIVNASDLKLEKVRWISTLSLSIASTLVNTLGLHSRLLDA